MQDGWKAVWSISYVFVGIFSKFKNRILLHIVLLKCQIGIFEIHQLWQSGFSRVYFEFLL